MKKLTHLMYFALLFSGLILIAGCNEMEAPTAANAGQQSLLKSSDAANGGDELVLNVDVDEATFDIVDPDGDGDGPFNVEGDTGSGPGTFQCWGWFPQSGSGNVSQVYNIAGRGAIMTQGREGDFLAIVGGTGDFRNVQGEAIQVFTGNGFDFTITFDFDDDFDDDDDDDDDDD